MQEGVELIFNGDVLEWIGALGGEVGGEEGRSTEGLGR